MLPLTAEPQYSKVRSFLAFLLRLECANDNELVCALIRAHLTACGIVDENYIANYAYAELHDSYKHGLGIWPMKIDSRDPETFSKEYDEQVEKVFPSVFS